MFSLRSFIPRSLLALEVSDREIEVLRLRIKKGRAEVADRLTVPLPEDPRDRSEALRVKITERKWETLPCVAGLSEDHMTVRCLHPARPLRSEALRRLVAKTTREFEALSESRAVSEIIYASKGHLNSLLMFTIREDTLRRELSLIREAGLKLADAIPAPLAGYEGLRQHIKNADELLLLVQCLENHSECIHGAGAAVHDFCTLSVSGRQLAEDAGEDSFDSWLAELKTEVERLQALHPREHNIRALYLGGLWTPSDEQLTAMREESGLEIRLLSRGQTQDLTARGLSRPFLISDAAQQISLLPPELRQLRMERQSRTAWAALFLLGLFSLAGLNFHFRQSNRWLENRRDSKQEHIARYERIEAEREDLAEISVRLNEIMLPLRNAQRNYPRISRVLEEVNQARDPQDWFVLVADSEAYFSEMSLRSLPSAFDSRVSRIILEGYTPSEDLSTVRQMIESLREIPFIEGVDLLPEDQVRQGVQPVSTLQIEGLRRFALEIELRGRPA